MKTLGPDTTSAAARLLASVRESSARILASTGGDPDLLRSHLAFHSLVAELSTDLIALPFEGISDGLVRALGRIASFGGDQRAWLSIIDSRGQWRVAHEWYEEGLEPISAVIDGVPATPWALATLSAGNPVWIRHLSDLGPEAGAEKALCEQLGVRSIVGVPIRGDDGAMLGVVMLASHDREGTWPEDFLPLSGQVGNMLYGALMRQREQIELGRSEARLRRLLDAGMLGILTAGRDGSVTQANDAALMVTGYDRAALEAGLIRWDRMTPPEYRHLSATAMDQLERSGHCPPFEQDFYRRDGSRVPVLLGLAALQDAPGSFLVFALDITARKRAERELAERKRLTRLITVLSTRFIGMPEDRIDDAIGEGLREVAGVVGLDRCTVWRFLPDGQALLSHRWAPGEAGTTLPHLLSPAFPRWNEAFARREFVLVRDAGRDLPEASPERLYLEARGVRSALAVPLLRGENVIGFVAFVSAREDEEWSESRVALLRLVGEIIGSAMQRQVMADKRREARIELEQRFAARTCQLESANRELEAFSHAVSHDLRAPLRGIDGFSRILVEDHASRLPEPAGALLERIRVTCQRMGGLIDALLVLSRISRSQPKRETVDLSAMSTSLGEALRESQPHRRVTFVVEPGLVTEGEPRLIEALLDNLLRNSWKFSGHRAEAKIEVGGLEAGRGRVFYVRDNGIGFDPAQAGALFVPFQRLHDSSAFEGFGVGLATVQRIVSVHGGRVWAEGQRDRGATVFFTLDTSREPASGETRRGNQETPTTSK